MLAPWAADLRDVRETHLGDHEGALVTGTAYGRMDGVRAAGWTVMTEQTLIDPRRMDVMWLLLAFVGTSLVTRMITRYIRHRSHRAGNSPAPVPARRQVIKDVRLAGIHVHHQVWGILLVLLVGLLAFGFSPEGTARSVLAAAFGIGAALALDEFAMWLHLDDVYWSAEGRKSISALMVAAAICAVVLVGANPLGIGDDTDGLATPWAAAIVLVNLALVAVCIWKGKLLLGLIGLFFPFLAFVGAWRLAKPESPWGKRRYAPGSAKLDRSRQRFGERYELRWRRVHDVLGGAPSISRDAIDAVPNEASPGETSA
ncbi:MAG: hypothetical protein IPJ15_12770 [Actinomycetales bacterium]|nr:hypothetical protein [Candidatus Phosphoribacter baldrii]